MKGSQEHELRPIFIHAMWRTGSTYVWKKFRDQQQYRAYFEPFNEYLVHSPSELGEIYSEEKIKAARHPGHIDEKYCLASHRRIPENFAGCARRLQYPKHSRPGEFVPYSIRPCRLFAVLSSPGKRNTCLPRSPPSRPVPPALEDPSRVACMDFRARSPGSTI